MRKFWEQFNHLERTLQAILALLAFALAVIFASVAAYLSVGIFNNPDNWQNQFIIPFTCICASGGIGYLGLRFWQRSKNIHCSAWGCDKPVEKLSDLLCSDCLQKREKGTSEVLPETITAPTCLSPSCQSPRPQKHNGFLYWCPDCWGKRKDKEKKEGLPQCIEEGCTEIVANINYPWCREHRQLEAAKGHKVDSHPEKQIADFLYHNGITYEYDKPLANSGSPPRRYDFFLPSKNSGGIYIEYFGFGDHPTEGNHYREKETYKLAYYAENKLDLIALYPKHRDNLESHIAEELRKRGIGITAG